MMEKQFEEQVKRFLESQGVYRLGTASDQMPVKPKGYWLKMWGGSKYMPAGIPDLHICIGVFNLDVELKNENGRLDPLQLQKLRQIKESGGYAMVLRPRDFEAFKQWVKDVIRRDYELKCAGEVWGCFIGASELFADRDV